LLRLELFLDLESLRIDFYALTVGGVNGVRFGFFARLGGGVNDGNL